MIDHGVFRLRIVGAVLLIAGGAVHTWLAFDGYGTKDLQTVFFLNGAGSAVVAAALASTRGPLAPLAGAGISAISLLAFGMSRIGDGVVGFRATGLEPVPEALLTLAVEAAALLVIGTVIVTDRDRLTADVRAALRGDR